MTETIGQPPVETRGGSYDEGLANGYKLLEEHPAAALQQARTLLRSGAEPRALQLEAAALRRLGKRGEAEDAELAAIKASFAIRQLENAAVAGRDGRSDASRALIEQYLSHRPDNLLALTMISELDIDDWQLDRAEQRLRTVIERAPSFLRAIMLLAKCLTSQSRAREAIAIIAEVLERKSENLTALRSLSQLYVETNDQAAAAELYARMLAIDPSGIDTWIMYAHVLRMLARKEQSIGAFRRAIELFPQSGAAWWGLAYYFPSSITDADVRSMESALAEQSANSEDGAALNIALGVLAERRGDFGKSFRHIAEGKRLRSLIQPHDAVAETAKTEELIEALLPALSSTSIAGHRDASPIFIIGMPRSGTTLLERILARHSQIEAGGELPILPRIEEVLRHMEDVRFPDGVGAAPSKCLEEFGERYVERSREYRKMEKPRFIDKLNFNWFRLGLIRLILPDARVIDLRRDALDCCWSNFKMMFAEGHNAANDQRDIARFYGDYVRMVEAVDNARPGGVIRVRYEDLVDDVERETRRILDFLGLAYEPQCIDFHLSTEAVATPSSEQVRRPINRDGIGSANPYRAWLGPMIEELEKLGL